MSQENVEIVREAFAEFERGNFWVGDIFHPDVRIVWLDALAGGETESLGVESMAATVREWLRTWDRMTMTAERITVVGDEVRCRGSSATATALSLGRSTSTSSRPPNEPHDVGSAWKINPRCSCPLPRWARSRSGRHDCTARPLRPMADVARAQAPARTRLVRGCRSTSVAHRAPARTPPSKSLFGFSPFNVIVLNAWKIDGPWIPPGRLDLAGEYMEARLGGVGAGSAHGDPLAGISVPTSDATPEELELALDIRAMLGAPAPEPDEEPVAHRSRGRAHPLGAVKNQTGAR